MKSAYLIHADKNPKQLLRLIETLDSDQSVFIIHVNGFTNLKAFKRCSQNFQKDNIHFVESRIEYKGAGFRKVEAIMFLIKFLFINNIEFDYAHLISSVDVPLVNSKEIQEFLLNNNEQNFLAWQEVKEGDLTSAGFDRVKYKWNLNNQDNCRYSDLEYKKSNQFWNEDCVMPIYTGSMYWSLNYNCLKFLYKECNEKNKIYRFFRYAYKPEEMLFHTMIMNSSFRDSVVNNSLRVEKKKNKKVISKGFSIGDKPMLWASSIDHIQDNHNGRVNTDLFKERVSLKSSKNCVISPVGKQSLHKNWIGEDADYDLHLIVYDDSFENYKADSKYVIEDRGFKFKLLYRYLIKNQWILKKYDYFYFPDDDIDIDLNNVNKLFKYMKEYSLDIAQPAVANSYIIFPITTRALDTVLRYTNFIEVMQPCFSLEALKKILFTFNANNSGWGIDYHWGNLVDFRNYNMAVIDDVYSVHTRPVSSNHVQDLKDYIKLYDLSLEVFQLSKITKDNLAYENFN